MSNLRQWKVVTRVGENRQPKPGSDSFKLVDKDFAPIRRRYGFVTVGREATGHYDAAIVTIDGPYWQLRVVRDVTRINGLFTGDGADERWLALNDWRDAREREALHNISRREGKEPTLGR